MAKAKQSKAKTAKKPAKKPTKKPTNKPAKKPAKTAPKKATTTPTRSAVKKTVPSPKTMTPTGTKSQAKAAQPTRPATQATKTTTLVSAAKAAGNAGATTNTGPSWKTRLRDELAKLPDDFAAYCAERGASAADAWDAADTDVLRGLEAWGTELAERDRTLGVCALVAIAQVGFPRAMASAGARADNMGFHAKEPSMDGAPVETQIARGAAWLADPCEANLEQVVAGLDPSRQLNVWEEDLLPQRDEDNWFWYSEVGQCISHAISGQGGDPQGTSYYEWTPAQSVARGMVMAVRGLRANDSDIRVITELRTGMVA